MKKVFLMMAIIVFIISIGEVEESYQEMTGRDSSLIPKVSRIDASYIAVSVLGEQRYINTAGMITHIHIANYQIRLHAKSLIGRVSSALGLTAEEEQPIKEAYGVEIL